MVQAGHLTQRSAVPVMLAGLAAVAGFAIAGLPLAALLIGLAVGAIVVGTLIEPGIGLIALLVLGPWAAWQNTYLPGLLPTDVGQLTFALTLGAWVLHGLARRELRIPRLALLAPMAIFTGWAAITMLWAPDYAFGLPEVLKWIEMILVAWLAVDVAERRGVMWIVTGLLLSATLQAVVGIYEALLRGVGPEGFLLSEGMYRAYGSFEQPNPFGGFIGLNLPIAIGLAAGLWRAVWTDRRTRIVAGESVSIGVRRITLAGLVTLDALVLAAALYLSYSRGAWLGAAAALLAMGLFLPRRRWVGVALIGGLLLLTLGLLDAGLLPRSISDRFAEVGALADVRDVRGVKINDANYAVIERLAHWQAAVSMIEANPWTGVGFSNYQPVYAQYRLLNWPMPLGHAHNIYLNIAAETGLPGLVAYAAMWVAIFALTLRALRMTSGVERFLVLGLLGAWVQLSMHHLFDNLYVDNVHLNIGAMLGLVCVLAARPPAVSGAARATRPGFDG